MQYKNKKRLVVGISLMLLLAFYFFRNLSLAVRVFGVIFGLGLFCFIDYAFSLKFRLRHYIYVFLILFGGILLSPLYFISPTYDKILHFFIPILGSIMIFFIVDKLKIKFQWKLLITFTAIMSVIAIHEIGEYLLDLLWDLKLQGVYIRDVSGLKKLNPVQSRIDDTMVDMIIGTISGLIFTIAKTFCYFYNQKVLKFVR